MTGFETFGPDALAALFHAVETDDVVDPVVSLPVPISLDCTDEEIRRCYGLCRQFWRDGVKRSELRRLAHALIRDGDLPADDRVKYKHIRARYKHLRFALTLFDERHRPPVLFARTVLTMGRLQDAFKYGDRRAVKRNALLLRGLASWPMFAFVSREVDTVRLESAAGFRTYRESQVGELRTTLAHDLLTGDEFHDVRKIISRQVAFHDSRRSLVPSDHDYRMSRYLSAINGLMGRRHDELVEQSISGVRHYDTATVLDVDVRRRLDDLIAAYPA